MREKEDNTLNESKNTGSRGWQAAQQLRASPTLTPTWQLTTEVTTPAPGISLRGHLHIYGIHSQAHIDFVF